MLNFSEFFLKSVEHHKVSNLMQTCVHKLVTCLETCLLYWQNSCLWLIIEAIHMMLYAFQILPLCVARSDEIHVITYCITTLCSVFYEDIQS